MMTTAVHKEHAVVQLRSSAALRALVDYSGLSEREIARRAGLSHSTINHLLTGRRTSCSASTAQRVCAVLSCELPALFV